MNIWNSFVGQMKITVTSADPLGLLDGLSKAGIVCSDVHIDDEMHLSVTLFRRDYPAVSRLIQKRGDALDVECYIGAYWSLIGVLKRPVLLAGICLLILLTIYLPTRVYFVRVEGNSVISDKLILEKARLCGINFGASRNSVRSEKVKNNLLAMIPDLQWAGINTKGCVAVITVRERSIERNVLHKNKVCSIVAEKDGIITSLTVYSGNPVCKVGQAVEKGQLLVSAYTDCGLSIKAEESKAEITANTTRQMTVVCMAPTYIKTDKIQMKRQHALLLGKKLINLFKYSGISSAGCDRIQKKSYLTLPGGFALPVSIYSSTITDNRLIAASELTEQNYLWVNMYADTYVTEHMVAGKIHSKTEAFAFVDGGCIYTADYLCEEMIGKVKLEENLEQTWND